MDFLLVTFHQFFIGFSLICKCYDNKISLGPPNENFTFHRLNIGFSWTKCGEGLMWVSGTISGSAVQPADDVLLTQAGGSQ